MFILLVIMCNNQCWKFDTKKSMGVGYKNHVFCKNCEVFFKKPISVRCPCCHILMRTRPLATKNKLNLVYI